MRTPSNRDASGRSFFDQPEHGWPSRRIIWSCTASRGPLLTRYFLLQTRWLGVYLHHLHASDDDRAMHDHPWTFVSLLLSSGYWEHAPCRCDYCCENPNTGAIDRIWYRRFSILVRPAEWRHRLELVEPCWTLVLRFRRRRLWGFWTTDGWLDWRTYGKAWCD